MVVIFRPEMARVTDFPIRLHSE